jgi:ribosomal protein L21E
MEISCATVIYKFDTGQRKRMEISCATVIYKFDTGQRKRMEITSLIQDNVREWKYHVPL